MYVPGEPLMPFRSKPEELTLPPKSGKPSVVVVFELVNAGMITRTLPELTALTVVKVTVWMAD